jgi:hypothetical protein
VSVPFYTNIHQLLARLSLCISDLGVYDGKTLQVGDILQQSDKVS